MKIAHIALFYRELVGVERKIIEQAKVASALGLNIDFYILSRGKDKDIEGVKFVRIKERFFPLNLYECMFRRYTLIKRNINLQSYDYIILRYPLADSSGINFTKEFKIITEHHSDAQCELLSKVCTGLPVSMRIIFQKITSLVGLFLEKKYSSAILNNCQGILYETDELRLRYLENLETKPYSIVTNGIDVDSTSFTEFRPFDSKMLNLIFIAAWFQPWQGLERLIEGLINYEGEIKIRVFLIGKIIYSNQEKLIKKAQNKNVNIEILGNKFGSDLDYYFNLSNIAVSTLSLYRKNMKEVCALKTREYVARGIPFIYAHNDPDIPENCDFALKFSNDNSPIEIEKIINFAKDVSSKKDLFLKMRAFAKEKLDWRIKIKQMYDFVESLDESV